MALYGVMNLFNNCRLYYPTASSSKRVGIVRERERERERVSLRDALKATDRARIHAHCSRAPWSTALHRVVLRRRTKCRTLRRAAQGVRYPRNRFVRDNIPPSGSVCTTSIPLLMATNWPSSSEIRFLCA